MQKIYFSYITERYSSSIHKMWPCFNFSIQGHISYSKSNRTETNSSDCL